MELLCIRFVHWYVFSNFGYFCFPICFYHLFSFLMLWIKIGEVLSSLRKAHCWISSWIHCRNLGKESFLTIELCFKLTTQLFYLFIIFRDLSVEFCIGHQMNEKMRNLIDKFQWFCVFKNKLFFISFSVSLSVLIKKLPLKSLEIWIFCMLAKFQ